MIGWLHRIGACVLRGVFLCGSLAILAACAATPDGGTYRDQNALIGVTSRYDDDRFAGVWHVRGAYPLDARLVQVQRLSGAAAGPVWELVEQMCDASGTCEQVRTAWPVETEVPGADRLDDPGGGPARRAVVMWVDEGFRTAAIGDPSGSFAWVLDRAPRGGADRIVAARQVLEFNGFDVDAMEMRP